MIGFYLSDVPEKEGSADKAAHHALDNKGTNYAVHHHHQNTRRDQNRNKAREITLYGGVRHAVNHVIIFVIKSKYLQNSILNVVSILLLEYRITEFGMFNRSAWRLFGCRSPVTGCKI